MEAKDTVMDRKQLKKVYAIWETLSAMGTPNFIDYSQQYQAEISFKAGYEEAVRKLKDPEVLAIADEALKQEKLEGIREVVEWFEKNAYYCPEVDYGKWKSQLKEWGL